MSFNYKEVERAVQEIVGDVFIPGDVVRVSRIYAVDFPILPKKALPGFQARSISDLNVAIEFEGRERAIVFSLRAPWLAVYYLAPKFFIERKSGIEPWIPEWNSILSGKVLEKVETTPGDRIVRLSFQGSTELEVFMFPARPNFRLASLGSEKVLLWKPMVEARQPLGDDARFSVRDFSSLDGTAGTNWMDNAYQFYLKERQKELLTQKLRDAQTLIQARLTKQIKLRGEFSGSLREGKKAQTFKIWGEALKGSLHLFPKESHRDKVRVPYEDSEIEISLHPEKTVSENVDFFFKQYKKLTRTTREVEIRLEALQEESKKWTSALAKLRAFAATAAAQVAPLALLSALLAELNLVEKGAAPGAEPVKKAEKKWERSGARSFVSKEGLKIWVGRNHVENEEIVIRLARGNDFWMHLKGRPGAHAVILTPKAKSPGLETLLDAATLVAYYSGVASGIKVEVDYTQRKNVKRVPGTKEKFLVTYTQNKTLMVKIDDQRIRQVLGQIIGSPSKKQV